VKVDWVYIHFKVPMKTFFRPLFALSIWALLSSATFADEAPHNIILFVASYLRRTLGLEDR